MISKVAGWTSCASSSVGRRGSITCCTVGMNADLALLAFRPVAVTGLINGPNVPGTLIKSNLERIGRAEISADLYGGAKVEQRPTELDTRARKRVTRD